MASDIAARQSAEIHSSASEKGPRDLSKIVSTKGAASDEVANGEVFQANVDGVEFRTVSWQRATVVFLKINFAMSILAIPAALAALGSVGGSLAVVGFTACNTCKLCTRKEY